MNPLCIFPIHYAKRNVFEIQFLDYSACYSFHFFWKITKIRKRMGEL